MFLTTDDTDVTDVADFRDEVTETVAIEAGAS